MAYLYLLIVEMVVIKLRDKLFVYGWLIYSKNRNTVG